MSTTERRTFTERDLELPPAVTLHVRLQRLPDPDGHPDGKRVRIHEPNRATVRLARRYDETKDEDLLWDLAAALMPDLSADEVDRLTNTDIRRVLAAMQDPIAALEQLAKNAAPPSA